MKSGRYREQYRKMQINKILIPHIEIDCRKSHVWTANHKMNNFKDNF